MGDSGILRAQRRSPDGDRFRWIVESIPDQVYVLEPDGTIQFVNFVVPGFDSSDVVGKCWLDFIPGEYHETMRRALMRATTEGAKEHFEVMAPGANHRVQWFYAHIGPYLEEGRVLGAILVVREVTERRHSEAQLIASDRLASVGTLAASIAHEINNPLAAVLANLELVLAAERRGLPQLPGLVDDLLGEAVHAAHRVRQIVRDLRIFAKPDEDKLASVDVARVVESTLRLAANAIRHRARLVTRVLDVPPVHAVESRLGQVLLNLLVNAAQAIPEGRADDHRISVAARLVEGGRVAIDVEDTGEGITEEGLTKLFTPFYTTKAAGEGTGLGLAISKRIVSSFGGELTARSQLGRGSCFTVTLDAAPSLPVTAPPPSAPKPSPARRGRILVVDDEPLIRRMLQRLLSPEHDVEVVESASHALDLIRASRFDVVLCDIMMPHMTGADFHAVLSSFAPEVARDVVFLTGGAFSEKARQFLDRVPNVRLEKPFTGDQLRAILHERLG